MNCDRLRPIQMWPNVRGGFLWCLITNPNKKGLAKLLGHQWLYPRDLVKKNSIKLAARLWFFCFGLEYQVHCNDHSSAWMNSWNWCRFRSLWPVINCTITPNLCLAQCSVTFTDLRVWNVGWCNAGFKKLFCLSTSKLLTVAKVASQCIEWQLLPIRCYIAMVHWL